MFFLSFFFRSLSLTLKSTVRQPHRSTVRHHVSVWHSHCPFATPISGLWVCANGECRCGFVPVVGLGCGFVWFGGCGFVSICLVFFFFFEVALVDVGLCRWWLWMLLWQWLLVAVVAAMVVVPLLLLLMMRMRMRMIGSN